MQLIIRTCQSNLKFRFFLSQLVKVFFNQYSKHLFYYIIKAEKYSLKRYDFSEIVT